MRLTKSALHLDISCPDHGCRRTFQYRLQSKGKQASSPGLVNSCRHHSPSSKARLLSAQCFSPAGCFLSGTAPLTTAQHAVTSELTGQARCCYTFAAIVESDPTARRLLSGRLSKKGRYSSRKEYGRQRFRSPPLKRAHLVYRQQNNDYQQLPRVKCFQHGLAGA